MKCVRCARGPRHAGSFLCAPCSSDPATHAEIAYVQAMCRTPRLQRIALLNLGWFGGWPSLKETFAPVETSPDLPPPWDLGSSPRRRTFPEASSP